MLQHKELTQISRYTTHTWDTLKYFDVQEGFRQLPGYPQLKTTVPSSVQIVLESWEEPEEYRPHSDVYLSQGQNEGLGDREFL